MLSLYRCRFTLLPRFFRSKSGKMSCKFSTQSNTDAVKNICKAALTSVQPFQMVKNCVHLQNGRFLKIGRGEQLHTIDVQGKHCYVVAFGKAVVGMVAAVDSVLGSKIASGIASVPTSIQSELTANGGRDLLPSLSSTVKLCEGAYMNIPDNACLATSTEIQQLVTELTEADVLITLTSGGGSALLCLPLPTLSLEDLAHTTRSLAKAGASIVELNTVRKHLEVLKGGGLASLAQPAQVVNLILSDIIGDPIDCIASGPTVVDTSTSKDALDIIERYLPEQQIRPNIISTLREDVKSAFLSEHSQASNHCNAYNIIIGSNSIALQTAVERCHQLSVLPVLVTSELCGEAAQVGRDMAELSRRVLEKGNNSNYLEGLFKDVANFPSQLEQDLEEAVRQARRDNKQLCLLFGGETTVEVKGSGKEFHGCERGEGFLRCSGRTHLLLQCRHGACLNVNHGHGKGGRNQEMCLSAMISMSKLELPNDKVTFTSIGTDGQDGPTDAAGACVTPQCMLGSALDPQTYLDNNDSYSFFSQLKDGACLVRTGLTGTNVMDVSLLLVCP